MSTNYYGSNLQDTGGTSYDSNATAQAGINSFLPGYVKQMMQTGQSQLGSANSMAQGLGNYGSGQMSGSNQDFSNGSQSAQALRNIGNGQNQDFQRNLGNAMGLAANNPYAQNSPLFQGMYNSALQQQTNQINNNFAAAQRQQAQADRGGMGFGASNALADSRANALGNAQAALNTQMNTMNYQNAANYRLGAQNAATAALNSNNGTASDQAAGGIQAQMGATQGQMGLTAKNAAMGMYANTGANLMSGAGQTASGAGFGLGMGASADVRAAETGNALNRQPWQDVGNTMAGVGNVVSGLAQTPASSPIWSWGQDAANWLGQNAGAIGKGVGGAVGGVAGALTGGPLGAIAGAAGGSSLGGQVGDWASGNA